MSQLSRILLIDDGEADNFIHARRLRKMGVAGEVIVKTNGREGLDYLNAPAEDGHPPRPRLIFLDINMPVMNGWEFLDRYRAMDAELKAGTVVVAMLTESMTERDRERAATYDDIIDERGSKPITKEYVLRLLEKYPAAVV